MKTIKRKSPNVFDKNLPYLLIDFLGGDLREELISQSELRRFFATKKITDKNLQHAIYNAAIALDGQR